MVYVQGNAQTQHQEIMIQSFACKKTQRLARGGVCHKDFVPFRRQAEKRLRVLDAASDIMDLMNLPSNHFEALRGKRQGYYSISRLLRRQPLRHRSAPMGVPH